MMDNIWTFYPLITEKKHLCDEYEALTNRLLICEHNEMKAVLSRRGETMAKIEGIDSEAEKWNIEDINLNKVTIAAYHCTCGRNELPEALLPVFDTAMLGFACLNRSAVVEPLILERMHRIRNSAETQLRSMKNMPKIAQYLKSSTNGDKNGILLKKKI